MPWCVLRYCTNNSTNVSKCIGITFHRFPRPSHENREKWIKFVQKNRSEEAWLPTDHTYICSLHFREEDKYTTKAGRRFLKKSAVPCDPSSDDDPETMEAISVPVSDSESILDCPKQISLKLKYKRVTLAKKKLSIKIKKVLRQNRNLRKKCESLTHLVKSLKKIISFNETAESCDGKVRDGWKAAVNYTEDMKKN